jgi:hypothetical protein
MKNSRTARILESDIEADPLEPRPLDFSKGVRGKYYDRMQGSTNVAVIYPDLLDTFPDSAAVNEALRSLKKIATRTAVPSQSKPVPRQRKTASASR